MVGVFSLVREDDFVEIMEMATQQHNTSAEAVLAKLVVEEYVMLMVVLNVIIVVQYQINTTNTVYD
jgi:hypothetical protein